MLTINTCDAIKGLGGLLCKVKGLLGSVVPVLIALGIVYFVWGVVTYVISDSEEAKKKGKDHIIFGIIGLTVIISLWALVYLVANTFTSKQLAPTQDDLQNLLPQ